MSQTCPHDTVTRQPVMNGHAHIWACTECTETFLPSDTMKRIEEESDRMLDMVTSVFSATLWDLHERAFEAHGIPHGKQDPLAEEVCAEKGHDRDEATGVCKRCGDSPFLGGE